MWFLITSLLLAICFASAKDLHPLSDDFIDRINQQQLTWKAGRNFDKDTPLDKIRSLLGVVRDANSLHLPEKPHVSPRMILPSTFDARKQWPKCPSIGRIRDQANCGSCWAFGATEAMSDRICIHSNGKRQITVSAADLLSCCHYCGLGCSGGNPDSAWDYWVSSGIVTGGEYGSNEGCKPYYFPRCEHHRKGSYPPCGDTGLTPKCETKCVNTELSYNSERTYGLASYSMSGERGIQTEIFENGPVEASFNVFEDFVNYKTGVYHHIIGDYMGGHSVKIIGWGDENGIPYWLIANSWNEDWGDNGFFKILRGRNECEIESEAVAGLPRL